MIKILLVDDHAVVREGVRRLLATAIDADIYEATSSESAQAVLRAEKPDLVLLDLNLPGGSGVWSKGAKQPLSARELDILRLLAQGNTLSEIAAQLGASYKTIANSCTGIKEKLMVERTGDLIRIAIEMHTP